MNYKLPYKGQWLQFSDKDMREWSRSQRDDVEDMLAEYHQNPLAHFLPHGVPWHEKELILADGAIKLPPSQYPKDWGNDGVAFMNDRTNKFDMLLAPRKTGKTYHGAAWVCSRTLKCDPNWPIFQYHKVQYHEFQGPTKAVLASSGTQNLDDLWSVYQEVMPRAELGPWAKDWGAFEGERGSKKNMSFGDGRPKKFTAQASGTEFIFLTYAQFQYVWESFRAQILHADEQIKLNLLMAWEDGSSPYGDYTPACFTLSGFMLDERPEDTGAAGPLKPMWDKGFHGSKSVGKYNMDIEHTPDAILSDEKKKERYDRYVNPEKVADEKSLRRGLAVYWPGWEPGSGLLFGPDVWRREIHVIPPMWKDRPPKDWTKWRVIDYADKGTTVCAWFAVGPKFAVLYRLLYRKALLVSDAAQMIIEMSGNQRVKMADMEDEASGSLRTSWQEVQEAEHFSRTMIDARAAKWRQQGEEVIHMFERYGLVDIGPAPTQQDKDQIPNLMDWLRIDYSKEHPFFKDENGKPIMGRPRLFIVDGVADAAIEEIERMPQYVGTSETKVMNRSYPHDFIDTAKYWATAGPEYMGDEYEDCYEEDSPTEKPNRWTGY